MHSLKPLLNCARSTRPQYSRGKTPRGCTCPLNWATLIRFGSTSKGLMAVERFYQTVNKRENESNEISELQAS